MLMNTDYNLTKAENLEKAVKALKAEGYIVDIGSVNGNVTDGSLYIGRLMVLPSTFSKVSSSPWLVVI